MNTNVKSAIQIRLNCMEGQVRGVQRKVERNEYCDDIFIQLEAIHSALSAVGKLLLSMHFKSCLLSRIQQGDETIVDQMLETMKPLIKR